VPTWDGVSLSQAGNVDMDTKDNEDSDYEAGVQKFGVNEAPVQKIDAFVLNMCKPLFRKGGYLVSMDNYHTSVTAAPHLKIVASYAEVHVPK